MPPHTRARSFSPAQPQPQPQPQLARTQHSSSGINAGGPRVFRAKEPVHLPLHRRLLYPTYPLDKALPQIFIPDKQGAVKQLDADLQLLNDRLYHLIALTLRAYVLSWYPRFSRDRTFLPTLTTRIIVPLLSPMLSGLYGDPDRLVQLILVDLPAILRHHLATYWQARQAISANPHLFNANGNGAPHGSSTGSSSIIVLGEAYHARLPLLSVSASPGTPQSELDAVPYRQPIQPGQYVLSPLYLTALSDTLLKLHLSGEEYGSPVERSMAREIIGRTVLGSVGRKLGDGWFWWSLGIKLLGPPDRNAGTACDREGKKQGHDAQPTPQQPDIVGRLISLISRIWAVAIGVWTMSISVLARYSAAPPLEARYRGCSLSWMALFRELLGVDGRYGLGPRRWALRLSWGVMEGLITLLSPFLDRLLPHVLRSKLDLPLAFRLCELVERLLFPLDGYPAPSPPDLTPVEAKLAREQFQERLQELIPKVAQRITAPTSKDLAAILDPFDDPGCNAHLVGMLLDSVVGALEPSLVLSAPPEPREADQESSEAEQD